MKMKEYIIIFVLIFGLCMLFFYKMFLYGHLPIPADLLVAEYNPWKTYSYLGYVPASFPNKAQYFDVIRQLYPWKTLVIDQLKKGEFPLWNPYNFSGAPLLANFQSAVFYPFTLLYFFFDQKFVWSFLVFLQPFLCSFFTYLYARKLTISKIGSLFAAVSFGFSSFISVWLEYNTIDQVILWLPLILLSVENLLVNRHKKWMLTFVFSVVFSSLAGHIQVFGYVVLFVIAYIFFRVRSNHYGLFAILFLIAFSISAAQFLPGIELIVHSARSPLLYDFFVHKVLIQPAQLIMFFVPDFFGNPATRNYWQLDTYVGKVTYVGIVSVFFIFISVFKYKERIVKFFWISAAVVLLLVTLNPFSQVLYATKNQFLLGNSPTLAVFLMSFCFSMLTGFGIDIWNKNQIQGKKYLQSILLLVIIFFLLWTLIFLKPMSFFHTIQNLSVSSNNLLASSVILFLTIILLLVGIIKKRLRFGILVLLLIVQSLDLFRSFEKFNPFSPQQLLFPENPIFNYLKNKSGIDRFWGYGYGYVESNFATQYKLSSPDGYDPLYPKIYGEFIQSSGDGKIGQQVTRSDAVIAGGFGELDLMSNQYRLTDLNMLGVRYILDRTDNNSSEKTFPPDRFKQIYQDNGWKIFENLKAAPRIFLTTNYAVASSNNDFEKIFFNKDFNPSKTIILEKKPKNIKSSLVQSSDNTVQLLSYQPNSIFIRTTSLQDSLLFVSDVYYPGWRAFIDSTPVVINKADYAFKAIIVPKGSHIVRLVYDPLSFRIGLWVSLVGLISLVFVITHREGEWL